MVLATRVHEEEEGRGGGGNERLYETAGWQHPPEWGSLRRPYELHITLPTSRLASTINMTGLFACFSDG